MLYSSFYFDQSFPSHVYIFKLKHTNQFCLPNIIKKKTGGDAKYEDGILKLSVPKKIEKDGYIASEG